MFLKPGRSRCLKFKYLLNQPRDSHYQHITSYSLCRRGLIYFGRLLTMEEFITFIKTIIWIDDSDLQLVLSRCTARQVPKGKLILKKGQIANQYFFIVSGGVRFFYEANDHENTTWVTFKNEFFTEISSLNPQKPSRFNIEAIEDTELVVIDKKDMDFFIQAYCCLGRVRQKNLGGHVRENDRPDFKFSNIVSRRTLSGIYEQPGIVTKNSCQTISGCTWYYAQCTKPDQEKYPVMFVRLVEALTINCVYIFGVLSFRAVRRGIRGRRLKLKSFIESAFGLGFHATL